MSNQIPQRPSFADALRFWFKLGWISFGGPSGQIAIMHSEVVEKRRWISEQQFLHALNYCMLLPGPEAQQLAIYIGWLLHKTRGGIVAGALFVLPSVAILWALSLVYVLYGKLPAVAAVFYGIKPAILAIIITATIRLGRRSLKSPVHWIIAALAFIAILAGKTPYPALICGAGFLGYFGERIFGNRFRGAPVEPSTITPPAAPPDVEVAPAQLSWRRAAKVCAICLSLWWLPVAALAGWLGPQHTVVREALFFSKAAMVTFGGAYAVLPYVAQQAVDVHQWLSAAEMFDGLGLAESTPGPLIMVLQFVGFVGAWHHPGQLSPLFAATLGAAITTWTTFLPCFLWIFLGAPHIERLRGHRPLNNALAAVSAAVAGVILTLGVVFGAAVLFPGAQRIDVYALLIAGVSLLGIQRFNVIAVIIGAGALGCLIKLGI